MAPGAAQLVTRPAASTLVEELPATLSSWDAFQRLASLPHAVFLDSAMAHATLGRYSFVAADPFEWLTSRKGIVCLSSRSQPLENADPFLVLQDRLAQFPTEPLPELPPFQGGALGLFGYDLCHHLEVLPRPPIDDFAVPDLAVGLYDWVLAFDHVLDRAWVISTGFPQTEPRRRRTRAERRLQEVLRRLDGPAQAPAWQRGSRLEKLAPQYPILGAADVTSNFDRTEYLEAVRRAIGYIHAGDCFQVNVAQRLVTPTRQSPLELCGRLRERNAAPFAGYFDIGEFVIASASPERFVRVFGDAAESPDLVETRPIKGTRPSGTTPEEEQARIAELLASAKDRAENVMIVDLLRNDLGRVCRYGSVRVPEVCRVETYRYVHHLVSVVTGRLRADKGPIDLLRAAFPGGSVTGAPKIRAMEIIAELEPTARGPYCGCLGYIGFDGRMDTNILIRTFTVGRGWVQFPVGGGIVADSDPQREYEETWHKAEGMLRALRD